MGTALLTAGVVVAACSPNTDSAAIPTSIPAEGGTTVLNTPSATTTTQLAPPTALDAGAKMTVVEGTPYRQPDDGDPSTVDIYLADTLGRPLVVLLHGWGGTEPGVPALDLGPFAEEIARLGSNVFYFRWHTNDGFSAGSAADLSCIGGFVSARTAEYGSDPHNVLVIGHSMGGEAGSKLALSSFGLAPGADCVETGDPPSPYAFLGIGGSYGLIAKPLDDDLGMFAVRATPDHSVREMADDEFVRPGLTALDAYALDGASALPAANPLRMVLLVGSRDQYAVTNAGITAAFAELLKTHGTAVEVVVIPDANHEDVVDPATEAGQTTLQVISDILNNAP